MISVPTHVEIMSESGPNQIWAEGFGGGRYRRRRSGCPEDPEWHLDAARQRLPRHKFAAQLPREAQQRYFSYRAILVAIVSQNVFVLVFMRYRTIIARYVAKWGIAQMCLCKSMYQGGGIAPFWGTTRLP